MKKLLLFVLVFWSVQTISSQVIWDINECSFQKDFEEQVTGQITMVGSAIWVRTNVGVDFVIHLDPDTFGLYDDDLIGAFPGFQWEGTFNTYSSGGIQDIVAYLSFSEDNDMFLYVVERQDPRIGVVALGGELSDTGILHQSIDF